MEPFTFFISYRRQDTGPIALLLKYEIEKRLQFVRVFVDVEDIRLGSAFPNRIYQAIDNAHAVIALIGESWMPAAAAGSGRAALDEDWVVTELSHAAASPIGHPEEYRYGLDKRMVIPLFVGVDRRFDRFQLADSIAYLADTQAEYIDYAGWPTAIGPLIDRMAVHLNLKKRPDADEYPKPDPARARTQPLADSELALILSYEDYEGWYIDNFGNAAVRCLVKTFKFPHFNQAADFMKMVSDHCRIVDHHPEWRNVFNVVNVSLTTWDARRRVTIYDLNLALFMNRAAEAVLGRPN